MSRYENNWRENRKKLVRIKKPNEYVVRSRFISFHLYPFLTIQFLIPLFSILFFPSHFISFHSILFNSISFHIFHCISLHCILFYSIPSHSILSYPILSYSFSFHCTSILFHSIPIPHHFACIPFGSIFHGSEGEIRKKVFRFSKVLCWAPCVMSHQLPRWWMPT